MNRLPILALLVVAALSSGCKDNASSDATPSAEPAASAAPTAAATAKATAAPTATAAPVDEGVKVTKKPPTVGEKLTESFKSAMTLKISMGAKNLDVAEDENRTMEEEVLEVSGDAVTKLKVTFSADAKSSVEDGKPGKAAKSPVVGKTYILVHKGGKTQVLNEKDKPAPAAEAKIVAKHFTSFGKPDPMQAAMPARAFKAGEKVPELTEAMTKELKGSDGKETVEDVSVSFKGKEGDRAVFTIAATMKNDGPFKMAMPLKGTFSMRISDGAPATMALEGPIELLLTDKDKEKGVKGQGTMKISSVTTFK